jgi:predicted metal-dependent HD superfamily phosphohydrolase
MPSLAACSAAVGDALGLACEGCRRDGSADCFRTYRAYHFLAGRGMVSDDTEHACMTAVCCRRIELRGAGMSDDALRLAWDDLVRPYSADPTVAEDAFRDLVRRYSHVSRHYHNLAHVAALLATIDGGPEPLTDAAAVRFAVWFHDAVYDTTRADNEERSADLAADVLPRLNVPAETVRTVGELIHMTKLHEGPATGDAAVFLDADLAVLGAPEEEYDRYAAAIRREYGWVPDDRYREGRADVLERFLAHERIYRTQSAQESLEQRARTNLSREIGMLRGARCR